MLRRMPLFGLFVVLAGCGAATPLPVRSTSSTPAPPTVTLALVNATLIDGTGAPALPDAVLLVGGARIVAVGARSEVAIPAGVEILDLGGATMLPGFINAHVHDAFDAARLETWAFAGVTTVRDEGILSEASLEDLLALRDELGQDPRHARLVSAGYMLCPPGGYGSREVPSAKAAARIVDEELDAGVDLIKLTMEEGYASMHDLPLFSAEELKALVDATHARGALVSVHVCDARYVERLLDAGVDDLAHIQYDPVSDVLIQRIVDEGVYVVPTLTVLEAYGALPGAQSNLRRFAEAGVKLALGNDYTAIPQNGFDHFDLGMPMHEITRMHEAGLTPMQIIIAATQNAARVCGLEAELGTLEAGKFADVLVVEGDPLSDLEALTWVRLVLHSGAIIRDSAQP